MHQKREVSLLGPCLIAGGIAAVLVYLGDHFDWPNFNRSSGYFGTEFMGSILYAINDPYAIHIVAFMWFCYAALITYICCWGMWSISSE